ncbi:hypothetical protein LEN26_009748 [Aphanomyces euteiches]|nr:hypothetical protein AeMF1_012092 [Aphanomyces euteiches]KAH9124271.1 hypothetical protein LEN26_009748 [Aphanomyces euteiches]KAH9184424.1 hypothetical protein AeNC1_013596 [Aphanomyces euteiches]
MKFRFCGDVEPPTWLLAEIPCIAQSVSQHGVDLTVVTEAVILAITKAASYNEVLDHLVVAVGDVDAQAILVSMKWILVHAAKYDIREADLLTEVQQLGLPSEMARTIASIYQTHQQELRRHLRRADTLANAATPCKWQVSYNLASRSSPTLGAPSVELTLGNGPPMEIDARTFRVLYHELQAARALMQQSSHAL